MKAEQSRPMSQELTIELPAVRDLVERLRAGSRVDQRLQLRFAPAQFNGDHLIDTRRRPAQVTEPNRIERSSGTICRELKSRVLPTQRRGRRFSAKCMTDKCQ